MNEAAVYFKWDYVIMYERIVCELLKHCAIINYY